MKVIVIGANSQVGEFVIKCLAENGYQSVAVINEENKVPDMKKLGATEVNANGRGDFSAAYSGCAAAIFISDSSPNTGSDKTVLVDQRAVIDAVKDAKQNGVRRFVMMSAIRADESSGGSAETIGAKHMPDELLRQEELAYTIIRPAEMTDEPGRGTVAVAASLAENGGTIPRQDVASVLVAVLENEMAFNKTFDVSGGDTPIREALQALK
ncbi:NAD(P)H-binding protein [Bacillus aerolatus]|uniref:NAD(P)H-binding protein n=1 Tax=Bacillus aerolatus TaxID=2653354 RepID=UPI001780B86F|nr:NAD(P)H-binding protein [Bacillus aerolatus]